MEWLSYIILAWFMVSSMARPCTPKDGPGEVYLFFIKDAQGRYVVKIGESVQPKERKSQWNRKCWPEEHEWFAYTIHVPKRKRMEAYLHQWATLRGAWLGRVECKFCHTRHQEKFYLDACGGIKEIIEAAEYIAYLKGWTYNWRKL
ncbi:hypothetical protein B0H16DRAFT_1732710 [Mycena metata]|uniref:Bacteriophage T5 Orf172 DNA-binding domain-containing protein n=1 Tax=Mycena metata TaxID=1033252 RepID=A0AAD7I0L6_9AGAR|nr:hypothetical protein B0H16DRAFT_1732710 [Mycena metata]